MLPERSRCLLLLEQAGCSPSILDHVQAVARLALALADHAPTADAALVEAGALLHDIGRSRDHGIDHVPAGIEILTAQGIDERVIDVVACHMGAGIAQAQAEAWGWPQRRYEPESLEERIVAHADNLTFATSYRQLEDVVAKLERKGLKELIPRMRGLHEGLEGALGIDPDTVAARLARAR